MKSKTKIIISVIITFIITISITVTASIVMNATDISFTSDKTDKTNVKDSLDELYNKAASVGQCPEGKLCVEAKISNVPIGSYISMTPTSTSYTPSPEDTGCAINDSIFPQNTINPSELNLWRVIRKNDDGTVDVVSEYVSSKKVSFCGREGYINFVGGLNTIAAQYTNEKYVQSTRHMGYSNQTERLTDATVLSQKTAPWTQTTPWFGDDNILEAKGGGDNGYLTDYRLVNKALGTAVATTPSGGGNDSYWFASRIYNYTNDSDWNYGVRYSYYNTHYSDSLIGYKSTSFTGYPSRSVRPILTLKSTVEIESGEGTSESPYKLV